MDITFNLPAGDVSCDMVARVVRKGWVTCRMRDIGAQEWEPDVAHPATDAYAVLVCTYPPSKAHIHFYSSEADVKPYVTAEVKKGTLVWKGDSLIFTTDAREVLVLESHKWYKELVRQLSGKEVDESIANLLSSMGLENKSYECLLAANGFDCFDYLLKAEVADLVGVGIPVGHARVLVDAIKAAPVVIPEPAFEGVAEPSESEALMKSFTQYDPMMRHDMALKATIYSAKLLECEAQLQMLRHTRTASESNASIPRIEGPCITGSWKEDKKSSECSDKLLIELSVPAAARKVLKSLDVTYHIHKNGTTLTLDEVSRFGSNKSVIELDNIRRQVRSGDNTAFVTGFMDADGSIHKVTELPNGLGISYEVWILTTPTTATCETKLTRKGSTVASQKRHFQRLQM